MKPEFLFLANSTSPDDQSGVATWRCQNESTGETVNVSARLESGDIAISIARLIDHTYEAGKSAGKSQIIGAFRQILHENDELSN